MTDAATRNMGGSQDSLRQAIGRLDEAALATTGRAPAAGVRAMPARSAGRWLLLLALLAAAIVAVVSLLAV